MKNEIRNLLTDKLPFDPIDNALYLGYRGSYVYGLKTDSSDVDLFGIMALPPKMFWGFRKWDSLDADCGDYDITLYSLDKYINLLLKSNPSVLGYLFIPDDKIIVMNPLFKTVIENRSFFMTKQIGKTFMGYAGDQRNKLLGVYRQGKRGLRRKEQEEKYGYDLKNACYWILMLRQGIEALTYGEMFLDRANIDAKELMDIKRGLAKLEDIIKIGTELEGQLKTAFENSKLPEDQPYEEIESMVINIKKELYGARA